MAGRPRPFVTAVRDHRFVACVGSTCAAGDLHCSDVFARLLTPLLAIVVIVALGLTVIGGRGLGIDATVDDTAGLVEPVDALEGEPAVPAHALDMFSLAAGGPIRLIPPVLHGTEEEHASPEAARVFRPPRVSFA